MHTAAIVSKFENSSPAIRTIRFADAVVPCLKGSFRRNCDRKVHNSSCSFDQHVTNGAQATAVQLIIISRRMRDIHRLINEDTASLPPLLSSMLYLLDLTIATHLYTESHAKISTALRASRTHLCECCRPPTHHQHTTDHHNHLGKY